MPTGVWIPYCGPAPSPDEVLARWNLDPALLAALTLALALSWLAGRGQTGAPRRALLLAAIGVLAVSFVSPLCALASALFTARTVHHLLLVLAAAPLLAWAAPAPRRMAGWARAGTVIVATVVFWAWHAPAAYAWALTHDAAYWLMQVSLLGSATAFWSAVRASPVPGAVAALLFAMVQMGLIGALLAFAPAPLYAPHLVGPTAFGLSPLEDQQIAGLVMWAPAAAVYLAAALAILARWIGPAPDQAAGA